MIDFEGLISIDKENHIIPLEHELEAIRNKNNRFNSREEIGTYENVFYPDGSAILCWINKEFGTIPTHWHPSIEIIMPLEGNYSIKIKKKQITLEEGDILIIPPGELHELSTISDGFRLVLVFDYTIINNLKGFSSIWSLFLVPTIINRNNSPDTYNKIKIILIEILLEYINDESHWELSVYTLFIQLFILLDRNKIITNGLIPDFSMNKQREYIVKFNAIFEFINEKYMEEITIEEAAKIVGFSKFHFIRLFKMFTNTSFTHYLNARRIRAAETLLLDSGISITEIALMSGFSSISTFNRVFKTVKNCTPTEFKQLLKRD